MASAYSLTSEQLLNNIKESGGYARPNRYGVKLFLPAGITVDGEIVERTEVNCASAAIPGRTLAQFDHQTGGFLPHQLPHSEQYGDLTLTFYLEADLGTKKLFDSWQDIIVDPVFGNLEFYENYIGSIEVAVLDRNDNIQSRYVFFEAWPKVIDEPILTYAGTDSILTQSVTFAYYQWQEATG